MLMAEMKKKRLSINLSFLKLPDSPKQTRKSTKIFEAPNGVVGLGILAALNDAVDRRQDSIFIKGGSKTSIFSTSSKSPSNPKSISRNGSFAQKLSSEDMELSEEYYTCVISHVGENLVEKRVYFEDNLLRKNNGSGSSLCFGDEAARFETADFLYSCFLCQKLLHGLDIFMYRGEKGFCSAECRYQQISMDEQKEKRRSRVRKPKDLSVSPCSFFTGVAAA